MITCQLSSYLEEKGAGLQSANFAEDHAADRVSFAARSAFVVMNT